MDGFALTLGGGEGVDVKAGAKKLQAGAQQLLGQVESQAGAGAGGDGSAGGSDWQVFHISYQSNVTVTVSSLCSSEDDAWLVTQYAAQYFAGTRIVVPVSVMCAW